MATAFVAIVFEALRGTAVTRADPVRARADVADLAADFGVDLELVSTLAFVMDTLAVVFVLDLDDVDLDFASGATRERAAPTFAVLLAAPVAAPRA